MVSRVSPGTWTVAVGGDLIDAPERLEHWDFFTPLRITRRLELDLPGVLEDCGLDDSAVVGAIIQWHSSSTNLRGTSDVTLVDGPDLVISLDLPGEVLGGTLRLESRVILVTPSNSVGLAPRRAGSVLWSDGTLVVLEGQSARFPIQIVDFERAGIPGGPSAAWYLHWSPNDLEAPTLGSLRLLLNREHPMIGRLVREGASAPELIAVQSALRHDIARQLIDSALANPDFDREFDFGPGALGTALQGLLDSSFGPEGLDSIRGLRQTSPQDFEVRLQAASRLFADGVA
jgi:hypothetical protein